MYPQFSHGLWRTLNYQHPLTTLKFAAGNLLLSFCFVGGLTISVLNEIYLEHECERNTKRLILNWYQFLHFNLLLFYEENAMPLNSSY